jgi:hypothetical protein
MPVRSLRIPLWIAAVLVLGAAAAPGQVQARARRPFWTSLIAPPASAQEVMKFEPMPAESAAALEKRSGRRARPATPPEPATPASPSEPAPGGAELAPIPDLPAIAEVSRGGDVVRIGSDIHIEAGHVIEGDVFALRGDIRVDGHVKGNVAATGGNVHLGSTAKVDGDVVCIGGELVEDSGAVVSGQRVTALRGSGDRRLARRISERMVERGIHERGGAIGFSFSWLLMSLVVAWAFTKIAPARTAVALERLRHKPMLSIGIGWLVVLLLAPSLVALALAMAILCITIVGIPLALLLFPAYGVFLALIIMWGFVLGASMVGRQVGGRWPSLAAGSASLQRDAILGTIAVCGALLLGSILHFMPPFRWAATLVWVLAWVTLGLMTSAGMGALLSSKLGLGPRGRWWPPFGPGSKVPPVAPPPAGPMTTMPEPPPPAPWPQPAAGTAPPPAPIPPTDPS